MSPAAVKNIIGNRAAKQITIEAAKGTAMGLVLAFGYKVTISDMQKNAIDNFYANYNPDEDKKK